MTPWYGSRYTGLFRRFGALVSRPHDPHVALHAGAAAAWGDAAPDTEAGGIGWETDAAEGACVGEAIERLQPYPLPEDQIVRTCYDDWRRSEPAVAPERWVLFHAEQHRQTEFPFAPFGRSTVCDWVCCRYALTGEPCWAPAELVYLRQRPGCGHRLGPGLSTGLASGRTGSPIVLRGLQEVLERDAVVGAWWGRYPLEEYAIDDVLNGLRADARRRVLRPNLTYRCYRIIHPYSDHVALVTLAGDDREGWCFSVGSACRETAPAAWNKALLEAIHGRHYVRYLKQQMASGQFTLGRVPTTFGEHAVWYSAHPQALAKTVFGAEQPRGRDPFTASCETLAQLAKRLGADRPVLFRSMTPPTLAAEDVDWHVVRVVVPGLQPLHGNHAWAHLGGPLWAPRDVAAWNEMPPHPMP